jgi:hypothetical protein
MKKSENNYQYLTKTVISARSQKCFDLRILPLCVHSCVCVLAGQIRIFDAVDAASHISGNYGTFSLKLWENKYFPLRNLPFQRALFIVLNPNLVNNSLFLLRSRMSVAPGRPLRVVSREETRQIGKWPEGQPRKCDLLQRRRYCGSRGSRELTRIVRIPERKHRGLCRS